MDKGTNSVFAYIGNEIVKENIDLLNVFAALVLWLFSKTFDSHINRQSFASRIRVFYVLAANPFIDLVFSSWHYFCEICVLITSFPNLLSFPNSLSFDEQNCRVWL